MAELGYEVARRRRRRRRRSSCSTTAGSRSTSRTSSRCCSRAVDAGRLRFTTSYAEAADVRRRALPVRRHAAAQAASTPPTCATSTPSSTALAPHLRRRRLVVGKSTVPVGTAARLRRRIAELAPAGEAVELAWNPEFLREGFAVEDTLRPDRLVVGRRSERAEQLLREVYASRSRGRHSLHGHRLRHRRAGQGRGERLPRHQDLVHQRDGRGLRGDRRRRHAAGRRARPRRADRPPVPQRRPRLRRRLPAQGHPRVHGPRRGARRRPGAELPARGRRDQHAAPRPRWSTWPATLVGGRFLGTQGRRARRGVQARQRRRPRLARAQRRGARSSCRARRSRVLRPARHRQRPRAVPDAGLRRLGGGGVPRRRPRAAPDRVAGVPRHGPGHARGRGPQRTIIDARNALDPERWRAAGWSYGSLGRP